MRVGAGSVRLVAMVGLLALVAVGLVAVAPPAGAAGGSYAVVSTGDQPDAHPGDGVCLTSGGACTLRAALTEANADGGASLITFAIPGGGTHTISIRTALPRLTDTAGGTTIDGYTEPGSQVNTDPLVDNAVLRVEIRGTGSSGPDALDIASAHNVVRGIAFYNLRLAVDMVFGGDSNAIVGNFIGTNASGTFGNAVSNANSFGVVIDQLASGNAVGRPSPADRNVISGNSGRGVMLKDAVSDNTIQNNIVGLTPDGLSRLPNADHGIDVNAGAQRTMVGGTGALEGNLVSGNDGHGIEVSHPGLRPTSDNQIIGNRIGTDPTGDGGPAYARNGDRFAHENVHTEDHVVGTVIAYNVIGNSRFGGVKVDNGSASTSIHDNRIGVSRSGAPISNGVYGVQMELGSHGTVVSHNIIAGNRSGVRLQGTTTVDNTISKNSIFANSRLGIDIAPFDLVNGASTSTPTNRGIHFPTLSSTTATSVSGQTCGGCTVELFVADSTSTSPSLQSSYGEGQTFLASTTATRGGQFTVPITADSQARVVTSTATDDRGNTSEFSRNIVVPPANGGPAPFRPFPSWDSFVARQLLDFAGSAGTAQSRAATVAQLASGGLTPVDFISQLLQARNVTSNVAPIVGLYAAYFGRMPDYSGLTFWEGRHRAGIMLASISETFARSQEFQSAHGSLTPEAFVRFLYQRVLGRKPEAAGLGFWTSKLAAGTPRSALVVSVTQSNEGRRRSAPMVNVVVVFASMLHRSPAATELSAWTAQPLTTLIASVRLSQEYAALVG